MATIIDFTKTGGMHFAQDDLAKMQEAYREGLSAIAHLCGDLVILYGMVDNGSSYSSGAVAVNGEILPFLGGGKMPNLAIREEKSGNTFRDSVVQEIYTLRKVVTTSVGGYPLSSFTRLSEIKNLVSTAQLNAKIADIINSSPAALDTLNELAAALGNDPNFAATVANNIAGKVSKTGDSMSGNLAVPNATADSHAVNKYQLDAGLQGKYNKIQPGWITVTTFFGNWRKQNNTVQYRLEENGRVSMRGDVWTDGNMPSCHELFTLPGGYRPGQEIKIPCNCYDWVVGGIAAKSIIVYTDGVVQISVTRNPVSSIALDSVSFFID